MQVKFDRYDHTANNTDTPFLDHTNTDIPIWIYIKPQDELSVK